MTVSPEHGKRYNTRDGQVTEPVTESLRGGFYSTVAGFAHHWLSDGRYIGGPIDSPLDLISEYIEPTAEPAWIEWHGGECPIKSDKTQGQIKLSRGAVSMPFNLINWHGWGLVYSAASTVLYRITENHEPAETAPIDMSQNRAPWGLLTDGEVLALSVWRSGGGNLEVRRGRAWFPVGCGEILAVDSVYRTVSPPVITEATYERHFGGHLCKITLIYHDGKAISGTVVV